MNTAEPLERLISVLGKLPGIGKRSAERMALRLLRDSKKLIPEFIAALQDVEQGVTHCSLCCSVTSSESNPCRLCTDPARETAVLCVVESPGEIRAMEEAGAFKGRYHAMMGKLSPMQGQGVSNPRIESLMARIASEGIGEVIMAMNTDVESDATAAFLTQKLTAQGVKVTRLGLGIPAGSGVAYSDPVTLSRAITARQAL